MHTELQSALEAGRLYRSTGSLDAALLRPHVYRSWERSHLHGADPRLFQPEALGAVETERLRDRQAWLIAAAQPYMRALSLASGGERHAAVLGDARAVILDVLGDDQTVRGPERIPGPGALLDEGACGANATGTALAEGGYVELVGPEHFMDGFRLYTCQGIPIHDGTGATVGVLSITVRRPEVGQRLREIVLCAAHAIEMDLLAERLRDDMERALSAQGPAAPPLERLLGDILQAQPSVRLRLEGAADRFARGQLTQARDLIQLAAAVLARFRRQAALWRGLALGEPAAPRPVALEAELREIAELLEVEAAVEQVEIVLHEMEPVVVEAAPHALQRALFRDLLGAIKAARGGAVHVGLRRVTVGGELHLGVDLGPGVARSATDDGARAAPPACALFPRSPVVELPSPATSTGPFSWAPYITTASS